MAPPTTVVRLYAGVLYELTHANGSWAETILAHLNGKTGANPVSSVSVGQSGKLYGTFLQGGEGHGLPFWKHAVVCSS